MRITAKLAGKPRLNCCFFAVFEPDKESPQAPPYVVGQCKRCATPWIGTVAAAGEVAAAGKLTAGAAPRKLDPGASPAPTEP